MSRYFFTPHTANIQNMPSRDLFVVRGNRVGVDPMYACLSNDGKEGNFVLLTLDDGQLESREIVPFSDRRRVEDFTLQRNDFRGTVHVDTRTEDRLLPLKWSDKCVEADLSDFRRAKSDDEIEALTRYKGVVHALLENGEGDIERSFRGVGDGLKTAYERVESSGFVQYRGGVKDGKGRLMELSKVVPKTVDWENRLERAYRGFAAVKAEMEPDVAVDTLNKCFMQHMDPRLDIVYGNVVHSTGFEGHEEDVHINRLKEYDYLRLGLAVGDAQTGEVAILYRSAVPVLSNETRKNNFRGTHIAQSPTEVLKQLETYNKEFSSIITSNAQTHSRSQSQIHSELFKRLCDPQNAGKTFGNGVDDYFRSAAAPLVDLSSEKPARALEQANTTGVDSLWEFRARLRA